MRLVPPPAPIRLSPGHAHGPLLRALALGAALTRDPPTRQAGTRSLALDPLAAFDPLGGIDLPADAPNAMDEAGLRAAGPLYFASELELAGVLPTAERVAGLFASGAINQPLGASSRLIHDFWQRRHERLQAGERTALFARAIEQPYFDSLLRALCAAIVAEADGSDVREDVAVATCAEALARFLAQRMDGMALIAARDLVGDLNAALAFLRDRSVQAAFAVSSLWSLLGLVQVGQGGTVAPRLPGGVQAHIDRGRSGQAVLAWLAGHYRGDTLRIDPAQADGANLMADAQRWLAGAPLTLPPAASPVAALPALY